jgi:hypothetical protein
MWYRKIDNPDIAHNVGFALTLREDGRRVEIAQPPGLSPDRFVLPIPSWFSQSWTTPIQRGWNRPRLVTHLSQATNTCSYAFTVNEVLKKSKCVVQYVFIRLADVYELIYMCGLSVNWLDIALKWYWSRISACFQLIIPFFQCQKSDWCVWWLF